jgi:hypothetical protein
MYKHAWSKKPIPPRFVVKESPLERQQRQLENYLTDVALAVLEKQHPPKMPWYQWKKYKTAVEGAGGINEWAGHRPEWEKAISAAKRTLKRTNRGRARNAATNGIGKKPSGKIGKKGRKTKSSKDSGSAST